MKTYNWLKSFLAILGSALVGLMLATVAYAANPETVTVDVEFVAPITIATVNSLSFGLLDVNLAVAETIVIAPNDAVTDAAGRVLGGTQEAAEVTVTATTAKTITILVDTIVNNTGYTLGTFICKYDTGADTACDGAGYTATSVATGPLLVGATLTYAATPAAGVVNGSFNVTVSYQ